MEPEPRAHGPDDRDARRHGHRDVTPGPGSPAHAAHPHPPKAGATSSASEAHHPPHGTHADPDEHAGHDRHAGHSVEMFRRKFWGTLLLSIPTVVWAPMIQHWFGYEAWGGPVASRWIPALFGTLVFVYGGGVFIKGAIGELADRRPGMMTLITLAITVALVFSLAVTLGFPGMDLWWELATLVTIMVLGHWIEMRSISQAQGALKETRSTPPRRPRAASLLVQCSRSCVSLSGLGGCPVFGNARAWPAIRADPRALLLTRPGRHASRPQRL